MHLTATHITYLHLCKRKLWLFANGLNMEHTSDLVAEGKLIHETAYGYRAEKWKEIEIDGVKIDRYDPREKVVREVKKSNKVEHIHVAQLKYYLYVLEQNGIKVNYGVLEYPKLRKTEEVFLSDADRAEIPLWKEEAREVISADECPPAIKKGICRKCAYYEFCFVV